MFNVWGNADDFKEVIKQLDLCEDSILDVYEEHMKEGVTRDKRDYKETRAEVQDLHDRVLIVEQSLKSYHKRLDGMNLNIKTDQ